MLGNRYILRGSESTRSLVGATKIRRIDKKWTLEKTMNQTYGPACWRGVVKLCSCLLIATFAWTQGAVAQEVEKRMTPELLMKLGRFSGASVNSSGELIAYTVREYDLAENAGRSDLHLFDLRTSKDKIVLEGWKSVGEIQWAKTAEGEKLFFVGREGGEAAEGDDKKPSSPQCWMMDPQADNVVMVTTIEDGIANLKVSPTGTHIAFTVDVKMDPTVNELFEDLPKADARIIDGLMYRHWNAWHDYAYTHLHVAKLQESGTAEKAVDLMEGIKSDCPVPPFGGSEQYDWSPDGKQIAFTMKNVDKWAESTDSDVYLVAIDNPEKKTNVTKGMPGYDNNPLYSPDGAYLAFNSMQRASFESDRNRVMVLDRASGQMRDASEGLDRTAHGMQWSADSKSIYFVSENRGTEQVYKIDLDSQGEKQISKGRYNWGLVAMMPDGKSALVSQMSMLRPKELMLMQLADGATTTVSHINDEIYKSLELPKIEERWVDATDGKKIHCWVIHPPDFDPNKKYPMLSYFQGGPQGQIGQWFSFRWNFHLMAAKGYVVVAPNRRGLPGFGRQWNDQISGDWGGQAMKDILSATDSMTAEPYVDNDRVAGIGASFGGYTAYWMMGNHRDRFCTLVSHCGVFNLESMYGSTEELFFVNYDLGGPYWSDENVRRKYETFSPHKFVRKWDTPLLVIHGEKDFRVPVTQGMEAFTAAQVNEIPSRFLYFPEEGHWVQSPQNSVVWQRVFYEWLGRYCKPGT